MEQLLLDDSLKLSELDSRDRFAILREIFFRQKVPKDPALFPRLDTRPPANQYYIKTIDNIVKMNKNATIKDLKDFYKLNDYGLRSEEFTRDHSGKHILFAGCSNTFGMGMPEYAIWPKLVYEKISKTEKLSGFFNVGISGGTITEIFNQIVAYSSKFGVPDVLFINLPEHGREAGRLVRSERPDRLTMSQLNFMVLNEIVVGYYKAIMSLFNAFNTEIYLMSWDHHFLRPRKEDNPLLIQNDPRSRMPGIFVPDPDELAKYCLDYEDSDTYKNDKLSKEFSLMSLDEDHPGFAVHSYWAEKMHDLYVSKKTIQSFLL